MSETHRERLKNERNTQALSQFEGQRTCFSLEQLLNLRAVHVQLSSLSVQKVDEALSEHLSILDETLYSGIG